MHIFMNMIILFIHLNNAQYAVISFQLDLNIAVSVVASIHFLLAYLSFSSKFFKLPGYFNHLKIGTVLV